MNITLQTDRSLRGLHCQSDLRTGQVTESPLSRVFPGRLVRIAHECQHIIEQKGDAELHHPQSHFCGLAPFSAPGPWGRRCLSAEAIAAARRLLA